MEIKIPKLCLVLLIGPSGCGKSTFAGKHFTGTEVLSSDYCRGLISDDENDQQATRDAFEVLNLIAKKRFVRGRLTVIDATNIKPEDREPLIEMARRFHYTLAAIVLDLPEEVCLERNRKRTDRSVPPHAIQRQINQMESSIGSLEKEGFRFIYILNSEDDVNAAVVKRLPLRCDRTDLAGPFDIIGDVHGCYDELVELLEKLGYLEMKENLNTDTAGPMKGPVFSHPGKRTAVFLGDIVDRGPKIIDTIKLVYNMVQSGSGFCVPGNHDLKLTRKLKGRNVRVNHGLAETLTEIDALPGDIRDAFIKETVSFLDGLPSHYVFDRGKLVVAHAGLKRGMQGRMSKQVREFCLYGETTGETDEFGLPIRYNWADRYRGWAVVVYGHTPVPEVEWLNDTVNIDTGCVFGGKLTALRYPEEEFVSVPARKVYADPIRPFKSGPIGAQ
jgi:protein phosphatase